MHRPPPTVQRMIIMVILRRGSCVKSPRPILGGFEAPGDGDIDLSVVTGGAVDDEMSDMLIPMSDSELLVKNGGNSWNATHAVLTFVCTTLSHNLSSP